MENENLDVACENRFANRSNTEDKNAWDYLMKREKQEIIPGVYLGPYASAVKSRRKDILNDGITHIVCVRDESESGFIKPHFADEIEYLVLDIADNNSQNLIPFFPRVRDFINDCLAKGGKVLVHGNAGISRSASLVISYIMDVTKNSFIGALTKVQNKRYCIHPNANFVRQLMEYEPIIKAQNVEMRSTVQKRSHGNLEDMAN